MNAQDEAEDVRRDILVDHLLADKDQDRFLEAQDLYCTKLRDLYEAGLSPDQLFVLAKT